MNRTPLRPAAIYVLIFAALAALTFLTVGVAHLDLGGANAAVAVIIAAAKAALVLLFFMHARGSSPLIRATIAAACLWLVILLGLTMLELGTRNQLASPHQLTDR
jgi:cytochrome c oxidase subunit 4